jgi:hypothetical protein
VLKGEVCTRLPRPYTTSAHRMARSSPLRGAVRQHERFGGGLMSWLGPYAAKSARRRRGSICSTNCAKSASLIATTALRRLVSPKGNHWSTRLYHAQCVRCRRTCVWKTREGTEGREQPRDCEPDRGPEEGPDRARHDRAVAVVRGRPMAQGGREPRRSCRRRRPTCRGGRRARARTAGQRRPRSESTSAHRRARSR